MFQFLRRHRQKIRDIGIGLTVYETFNNIFDLVFYPVVLTIWGVVTGGAVAIGISLLINIFVFWLYDYMRVDWLGAHALRQIEEEEHKNNFEKLITWLGKKKTTWHEKALSPIVFVALTLPIDPVIVAIHHRHRHFEGVSIRDWMLLIGATIAANLWWILKLSIVIEGVKWIWFAFFA